jgi:hypothetical protein
MKPFLPLLLVLCTGAALAVEPATEDEGDNDPGTLLIDIGRNGLILDRVIEFTDQATPNPPLDLQSPVVMSSMLRADVWKFNYARESMCLVRYLPKLSCVPPYLPRWLHETPDAAPSMATLRARQNEVSSRIVDLWDAACEEARKRLPEDEWFPRCSME